jgi:hypothetical protein
MGISYGDFLWGFLMGISYGDFQLYFVSPAQLSLALPSPAKGPFHLPLMGILNQIFYNKLIVQSTIENPHNNQTMTLNISYHDFYGLC